MEQKPGYNLPTPVLNTKVPQLIAICNTLQVQLDGPYKLALDGWYGQVETWTNANLLARSQSSDPLKYTETPWTMKVPERIIADYDDAGIPTYTPWTDPSIQAPHLPPYVKPVPNPNEGFHTTAPQEAAAAAAKEAAMFGILMDIQRTVRDIQARLPH